jgi:hypothetical protein
VDDFNNSAVILNADGTEYGRSVPASREESERED